MKILYIWFKEPGGIPDGGILANTRNFYLMQDIFGKDNVDVLYVHKKDERISLLKKIQYLYNFFNGLHNGITKDFIKEVLSVAPKYQFIFLSSSLFGIIAKELKEAHYQGTIISHFHNVESIYYDAYISRWIPGRQIIINCAKKNDRWSCKFADIRIALNKRDKDILEKLYNCKIDYILPISLTDKFYEEPHNNNTQTAKRPLCTFIGSNFGPNREGIIWFIKNVLPHVDIKLRIVGKHMNKLKKKYEVKDKVEIFSDVQDLSHYYLDSDFMIFPIFKGSGMKVKTCESLMYGKNIIGTKESFEGYDIDITKVGALCNSKKDFINSIKKYSKLPINKFNSYSRDVYLRKYSYEATLKKAKGIFLGLISRKKPNYNNQEVIS